MKTENNNIIFTVLNKKLIFSLGIIIFISLIAVILFFTVIKPEYMQCDLYVVYTKRGNICPFYSALVFTTILQFINSKSVYDFITHSYQKYR